MMKLLTRILVSLGLCMAVGTAAPVAITNYSFETPQLGTTGTTWSNALGAPWTGTSGTNNGNAFIEYIANFFSNTPDQPNNRQHIGMNAGYDVWQDGATTYAAGTTYTLTVAVGNRAGTTNAANASAYALADATTGFPLDSGVRNASQVAGGTFADAPALTVHVPPGSPLATRAARILLQARGTGRSHYDNVRLDASPMNTSLPGVINAAATGVSPFSATAGGSVTQVGSDNPAITIFYGPSDGGSNAAQWANSVTLGSQSGAFNALLTGLIPSTAYHFRIRAVNSTGTTWSVPSERFTTGAVIATPLPVGNFSFEQPQLGTTGTTWTNALGAPWTGSGGNNNGNAFIEYIANFRSDTPTEPNNRQHIGMATGYDVWQDTTNALQTGKGYMLTVGIGNRSGSTDAANASTYAIADTNGVLIDKAARNAGTVPAGAFGDAPPLVFFIPPGSPYAGTNMRVLLQARGPNRSHFDNIRLSVFDMPADFPGVITNPATAITDSTAVMNGTVTQSGSSAPAVTFYYGPVDGGSDPLAWTAGGGGSITVPGSQAAAFSATVSGLAQYTTYYYRVRAVNPGGATWSVPSQTFTTQMLPPTVANAPATNVGPSSAVLGGTILTTGGRAPVAKIYYGTTDGGTVEGNWAGVLDLGQESGAFSGTVTGLQSGALYYFRAAGTNLGGTGWAAASGTFTTGSASPATILTLAATNVDLTDANLNCDVTATGGDIPSVTIYYGTTDGGTTPGAWTSSVSLGLLAAKGSVNVAGLTGGTAYFFKARAVNGAGSSWGDTLTFNTDVVTPPVVVTHPASNVIETLATLRGEVTNAGDETPAVKFYWGDNDGGTTAANWDNEVSVGTDSGAFDRVLTGLTANTAYYFRAFAQNSAGASWAASTQSFITAVDGTAANLVINEILYDPIDNTYFTEFVEIYNPTASPVDLSGWSLGGDLRYTFGSVMLAAGDYIVVVQSPTNGGFTTSVGFDAAYPAALAKRVGPWTRRDVVSTNPADHGLRNSAGVIELWNGTTLVDAVDYKSGFPWPTGSKGGGTSHATTLTHSLLNPALDNSLGAAWRAVAATPGAANTGALGTRSAAPPSIRDVDHSPKQPAAGAPVVITAVVTDADGVASVNLQYQEVLPGSYIRKTDAAYTTTWATIAMNDTGTDGDAFAGDSIYTATVPGAVQTHRKLVRYRIAVTDAAANAVTVPYSDDETPNFAYFCYNGVPAWQGKLRPSAFTLAGSSTFTPPATPPETYSSDLLNSIRPWHMIALAADVNNAMYSGTPSTPATRKLGTLVYDGVVYDHIQFGNRGIGSTFNTGKNKWGIFFNRARNIQVLDNWGRPFDQTWNSFGLEANAYPWASVHRGGAGVEEAAAYRAFELAGIPSLRTTYVHWRVIDGASEAETPGTTVTDASYGVAGDGQYAGDFWGLYMALEPTEGNFLDERNLPVGNLYAIEGSAGDKKAQGPTQPTGQADWIAFRDLAQQGTSAAAGQPEQWYRDNIDLPALYTFMAVSRLAGNVDVRPGDNWRVYHRPTDNRWVIVPYDLDMMFIAAHHWGGAMDGITVAGAPLIVRAMMRYPAIAMEYRNRCREIQSLLASDGTTSGGQMGQLLDEYAQLVNPAGVALTWADADAAMWNLHPRTAGNGADTGQNNGRGNFFRSLYRDGTRGGLGGTTQTATWIRELADPDADGFSDHESIVEWFTEYATNTYPSSAAPWSRKAVGTVGAGIDPDVNRQLGYGFKYLEWEAHYGGYFNATVNPTLATPNIDLHATTGLPLYPAKPVITYAGAPGYPANDLRFTSSDFADPGDSGSIAAVQWRVGEITAPGLPGYDPAEPRKYEVEEVWTSPEIATASPVAIPEVRVPAASVRVGHTYRARVRHKDNTGRWSYWSEPVQLVVGLPVVTPYVANLRIAEINYNPGAVTPAEQAAPGWNTAWSEQDFEFIEVRNIGTTDLDLTDVRFTKGIDFDFPPGYTLAAGASAVVVKNPAAFAIRYPSASVAGSYGSDNLGNGGEEIKLSYGSGTAIIEFTYDDAAPWPASPDGAGPTLVLKTPTKPGLNHADPAEWRASYLPGGNPGDTDGYTFAVWAAQNPGSTNPAGDEDNDSFDNRLEYALMGDPAASSTLRSPTAEFTEVSGLDYATLTFTRRTEAEDATFNVQFSTELMTWGIPATLVSSTVNGDGTTTQTWRSVNPVSSQTRLFGRVQVTLE